MYNLKIIGGINDALIVYSRRLKPADFIAKCYDMYGFPQKSMSQIIRNIFKSVILGKISLQWMYDYLRE